ncbi:hypothetical protein D1007_29866 [Hordeum vulgare]|nr:hypothetical protein D1007_29866 [Hordeum vulgare]
MWGGDEEMSEIERDKLSFQEVKGFLKDHMEVKDSMKLYFLIPGKHLINGLLLLHDDSGCMRMADYICVGGVADIYIEYHQEEDKYISSGSDFEDELMDICESDASQPDHIISAELAQDQEDEEYVQLVDDVFVTDCSGVIAEVIKSPAKQPRGGRQLQMMKCHLNFQFLKCAIQLKMQGQQSHNKSSCEKNPERGKKKNAHLIKTTKKRKASKSGSASAGQATTACAGQATTASASQPRTSSASQPTSAPSRFRPPRQKTGASGSGARGATRHRGRKDAEDYPSYRYFTAGSGGQD